MKDADWSDEAEASFTHFQEITSLSKALKQHGLLVLEHTYNHLVFGSFTIVVGRADLRLRFVWDGHDSFLAWMMSHFGKLTSTPKWVQHGDEPVKLPLVFRRIAAVCEIEFGIQLADEEQSA